MQEFGASISSALAWSNRRTGSRVFDWPASWGWLFSSFFAERVDKWNGGNGAPPTTLPFNSFYHPSSAPISTNQTSPRNNWLAFQVNRWCGATLEYGPRLMSVSDLAHNALGCDHYLAVSSLEDGLKSDSSSFCWASCTRICLFMSLFAKQIILT